MLALKCDVCGNFYINEPPSDQQHILTPSSIVFEYHDYNEKNRTEFRERYDICPKCYLSVKNVLKSKANSVKRPNDPA